MCIYFVYFILINFIFFHHTKRSPYFLVAVQSIQKKNLVEVKSMSNPPLPVKMALESICLLLGESTTDWKVIRSILTRDNFISSIVNFSTDSIT